MHETSDPPIESPPDEDEDEGGETREWPDYYDIRDTVDGYLH